MMSATAQHLLGQLADGRFPLRKLLGVSQNSAVFLTTIEPQHPGDPAIEAAIKLIPEDPATSDLQLGHWRAASALSHPGLLRIHHFGRCTIDGSSCLYIVSERADEDLGQLLPRRALTPDETNGMLAAVLPTLDFLHESGFVHAGVKPSNIHATGDNVKLSADRIVPAGESASTWRLAAPFAAPESVLFPASDMWSLGVSICETLSKILPQQRPSGRFVIPELPAPYAEIVRSSLVEDVTQRITLDQVRSLLDPSYVAKPHSTSAANQPAASHADPASVESPYIRPPGSRNSPEALIAAVEPPSAASPSTRSRVSQRQPLPEIDPLAVPLSPVSPNASRNVTPQASRAPIPVTSLPQVNATIGSPRRVISPNPQPRSNRLFLVSAAAAIILAIVFVPRLILRSSSSSTPNSTNSSATSPVTENSPAPAKTNPSSSSNSANTANSKANSAPAPSKNSADLNRPVANSPASSSLTTIPVSPSPNSNSRTNKNNPSAKSEWASPSASLRDTTPPAAPPSSAALVTHAPSNVNPAAPSIQRKVLPVVSEKARSTIRGNVRINVRVQLNPDGTVSSAELATPAPSQFFADLALKAARQWQFAGASASPSEPLPSSTVIRFDFTQTSTAAYLP
jgi:TonB family protein